jgi:hypothetical protein
METLQITLIDPRVKKLLRELASLKLIAIDNSPALPEIRTVNEDSHKNFRRKLNGLGQQLLEYRQKNGIPEEPFSMEEIVAEVKKVRAERYAKRNKKKVSH